MFETSSKLSVLRKTSLFQKRKDNCGAAGKMLHLKMVGLS
jgi:hypothetical protein